MTSCSQKSTHGEPFLISQHARRDLDDLDRWLEGIAKRPARRIAVAIGMLLRSIASDPLLVTPQSELTRLLGEEFRVRFTHPYSICYIRRKNLPEIIAIIHHARDTSTILFDRLH